MEDVRQHIEDLKNSLEGRDKIFSAGREYKDIDTPLSADTLNAISNYLKAKAPMGFTEEEDKNLYDLYSLYILFELKYIVNDIEQLENYEGQEFITRISNLSKQGRRVLQDIVFPSVVIMDGKDVFDPDDIGQMENLVNNIILGDPINIDPSKNNINPSRFIDDPDKHKLGWQSGLHSKSSQEIFDENATRCFEDFKDLYQQVLLFHISCQYGEAISQKSRDNSIELDITRYIESLNALRDWDGNISKNDRINIIKTNIDENIQRILEVLINDIIDNKLPEISNLDDEVIYNKNAEIAQILANIESIKTYGLNADNENLITHLKRDFRGNLFGKLKSFINDRENIDIEPENLEEIKKYAELLQSINIDDDTEDFGNEINSILEEIETITRLQNAIGDFAENPLDPAKLGEFRLIVEPVPDEENYSLMLKAIHNFAKDLLTVCKIVDEYARGEVVSDVDKTLLSAIVLGMDLTQYKIGEDKNINLASIVRGLEEYFDKPKKKGKVSTEGARRADILKIFNSDGKIEDKSSSKSHSRSKENDDSSRQEDDEKSTDNIDDPKKNAMIWQTPLVAGGVTFLGATLASVLTYAVLNKLHNEKSLSTSAENVLAFLTKSGGYATVVISTVVLVGCVGLVAYLIERNAAEIGNI